MEAGEFSGVALIKRGDDVILHEAHGFAHRGFAIPNTVQTRFDIASVTKLFTAAAILQLVERGDLALDTPVMPYLDLPGTRIADEVTVYHCLTHTSGIGDDADEDAGEDYEALFIDKPNYSLRETKDFLPQFVDKEPNFPPGEGVRYNNVAFVLLGLAIERASGLSYRDYVKQHVFERAGMSSADFLAMDGVNAHFAEHYKRIEHEDGGVEWRKNIYSYPPIGSPDGGATVTALDLDTYFRALGNSTLLSGDTTKRMLTPQARVWEKPTGSRWIGFATQIDVGLDGQVRAWGKDGINAGVASQAMFYPVQDTSVILLANQDCNVWALHREIEAVILP